jgi:hypothetical protein
MELTVFDPVIDIWENFDLQFTLFDKQALHKRKKRRLNKANKNKNDSEAT